ncbi:MAG TPA: hypothetical protein VK902_03570 [Rubrobacter sp.]|nr:hypothetical protein [Rubrobacter sp.]
MTVWVSRDARGQFCRILAPESVALGTSTEEIIKALGVVLEWTRSRAYG